MIWLPGSPATKIRPIGPTSPIRRLGLPRLRLAGGQSLKSARCASRVCTTTPPAERHAANTAWQLGTMALRSDTSLPSVSPKPPGSTKSRCMSMMTRAVLSTEKVKANGCAATLNVSRASASVMPLPFLLRQCHDLPHHAHRPYAHPTHAGRPLRRLFQTPRGLHSSPHFGRPAPAVHPGLR